MKKMFVLFLLLVLLAGCEGMDQGRTSDPAPFENAEWVFYNEVTKEHDRIFFGEDGSFFYNCECGEPVGDSDCYDSYCYDAENLTITLFAENDDIEKVITLLSYNVNHLLLEIDGVIRDFTTVMTDTTSQFWQEEGESYLSGYEMTRTLTNFTDKGVMTAAFRYDTETESPKGTLEEFVLAEDAVFFELGVFSLRKPVEDESQEISYDTFFTELSRDEMMQYMEKGGAVSYLWLNDKLQIEKVVVFEMNVVTQ